jgi:amidase
MAGVEPGPEGLEPATMALIERGRRLSAPELVTAFEETQRRTRRLYEWWEAGFDLLLTPTLGALPPSLGYLVGASDDPGRGMLRTVPFSAFTMPFNQSGQPAISVPMHWTADDIPVGVQLVAAWGREDVLLDVAALLEQIRPWAHRHPPVSA